MNWLTNIIDAHNNVETSKKCFVRRCDVDDEDAEQYHYFTLCDYDSGYCVLGPFVNEYGKWETAMQARAVAIEAGYECNPEWDDV